MTLPPSSNDVSKSYLQHRTIYSGFFLLDQHTLLFRVIALDKMSLCCFSRISLNPAAILLTILGIASIEQFFWLKSDILIVLKSADNLCYYIHTTVIMNVCPIVLVELNSLFTIKTSWQFSWLVWNILTKAMPVR